MYTWQDIEQDWLIGGKLNLSPDAIVSAFNLVVDHFGREWVEASRVNNGVVTRGTSPTLHIVALGQLLRSLEGVPNTEHLLDKLREQQPDAWAELAAIHLVRSGASDIGVEVEPVLVIGTRNRMPDFRTRQSSDEWTYVEVTQPSTSDAQADVLQGLKRLTDLVKTCEGSFTLEVFLKRDPTPAEVEAIAAEIIAHHASAGSEETELGDGLVSLYWNTTPPGLATLDDHGRPYTPRLGMMQSRVENGVVLRHISIRWPFTDTRAKKFLRAEARQLPTDAPGLIMIQTSGAVGAMKAWRSLIEGLFQPTVYTRVSAVCLFSSGQWPTPDGDEWRPQTKLVRNPHARIPLPSWIAEQLERFPSDEEDL